jgi:hypothetical protein
MIGREPFRVDILTDLPGVTFDDAWTARSHVTIDGVTLPVIGRAQFITNKRAVGQVAGPRRCGGARTTRRNVACEGNR